MNILKLYGITTAVFFAIDMLWLGLVARNFYRKYLAAFLSPEVNWPAAIIFYLLYIGGILYFAVLPAQGNPKWAAQQGAVLGLLCYATYDLTNMATLNRWPLTVVIVDIVWGTVLTAAVAWTSVWLSRYLLS